MISAGLGVPLLGAALLLFVENDEAVALSIRDAFGPVLIVLLASPVLFVICWGAFLRSSSPRALRVFEVAAAIAALAGVWVGAAVASFMFHPGEWLEAHNVRSLLLSPRVALDVLLRTGAAACLGSLAVMLPARRRSSRTPPEHVDWLGTSALVAALGTTALASAVWVPVALGAWADPWWGVPVASGIHGGRAARMATVAIMAGVCVSLALALHARARWRHLSAATALALLAMVAISDASWQEARRSSVRPWAIPGLLYANGTRLELVRTERRSPLLDTTLRHSRDWIGGQMFARQCRACHEPARLLRQAAQDRGFPGTRTLLEQLRDADQYGSQYRSVMPPLVGCDAEVDALARWLCGQP